jgi:hypothetical protein
MKLLKKIRIKSNKYSINKYLALFILLYIIGNFTLSSIPAFHNHTLNKSFSCSAYHNNKLDNNSNHDVCLRCQWLALFHNIIDNSIHLNLSRFFVHIGYVSYYISDTYQADVCILNARSPPFYS